MVTWFSAMIPDSFGGHEHHIHGESVSVTIIEVILTSICLFSASETAIHRMTSAFQRTTARTTAVAQRSLFENKINTKPVNLAVPPLQMDHKTTTAREHPAVSVVPIGITDHTTEYR